MIWPAIPLLALLLGLANHARGRGTLIGGRWMCAATGGIGIGLVALLIGFEPLRGALIAVSTTLGFYNWLCWGWGLYFAAFTWQWRFDEKEISWIDKIVLKVVPFQTPNVHWSNGLRGLLGMALRGLYLIPMFLLFDPLHGFTPNLLWLAIVFGPLQGVIYAANRLKIFARAGTAWPELVMGALVGALAGTALVILSVEYANV